MKILLDKLSKRARDLLSRAKLNQILGEQIEVTKPEVSTIKSEAELAN